MKNKYKRLYAGIAITLCLFGASCVSAQSEQKISFMKTLEMEERQAQEDHDNMIMNASTSEFKAIVQKRMDKVFEDDVSTKSIKVIVDMSTQINSKNSLQKSFSIKNSSTNEAAILKIQSLLDSSSNRKSLIVGKPQAEVSYSGLSIVRKSVSVDATKEFHTIQGQFNRPAYALLIDDESITDIYPTQENVNSSNYMETLFTLKGRILPRLPQKQYSKEFIRQGLYKELMSEFDTNSIVTVEIGIKIDLITTNQFLESLKDYSFSVVDQGRSYVTIETTKNVVEEISDDSRIEFMRIGIRSQLIPASNGRVER